MNTKTFISLLQRPDSLKSEQLLEIEKIIEAYPFFQAPRALLLKGLKNQESYRYNTVLKNTAAYTVDRHVLFDFITSAVFEKTEGLITSNKLTNEKKLEDIEVADSQELQPMSSVPLDSVVTMKMQEADEVLDPKLFVTAPSTIENVTQENTAATAVEILQPDTPLEFDQSELYSFSQWLKIASLQPVKRVEAVHKETENNVTPEEEKIAKPKSEESSGLDKADKFRIIDDFIAKNPKIGPVSSDTTSQNFAKQNHPPSDTLMTETLAKVYVAQRNYKKAIQAYTILILKNPEKSGFFADQIRAIKKLQHHK